MIRLLIVVIGLFLIWVLFFSSFNKQRKIVITAIAVVMSVIGVWLESNAGLPKKGVISTTDVTSCGVTATHSYRSNYDLVICLRNNASEGQVKQIGLVIEAQNCSAPNNCIMLEKVQRDLNVDIAPNTDVTVTQNLSFDAVEPSATNTTWSVQVASVKGVR